MNTINTKTLLTVKTDKTLKQAAQELAGEIGISLGTLVNSFLKQFVRNGEISFSVSYKPNAYLAEVISNAENDFAKGLVTHTGSTDELVKKLHS